MDDKIISFLAFDGKVNIKCINSTNLVEEARKIHDLSPVTTAALGRLLTMGSLMGSNLKDENDKTIFTVGNINETPEDAIIGRDLFDAGDYLAAVRFGIKLANFGYTDVVIAKRVNLEDEDGIC